MEPGPKALLETQMPVEATAAPGPRGPQPLPLEQRPDPQRSPLKATAGRAGPSGTSPLCSPGWHGRQADARQTPQRVEGYCVSWQVHSLSRSCHSLFLLRAARCILRNVPSRMQCKQCRRKIQLLGQSWDVLGRLLPYTWGSRGKWGGRLPWSTGTASKATLGLPERSHSASWGKEKKVGQPFPDFCPDTCTAWEPVFVRWAGGGSSKKGQEGHTLTDCLKAVPGSWPGAVVAQPSTNIARGARPSSCFTPSVATRPAGTQEPLNLACQGGVLTHPGVESNQASFPSPNGRWGHAGREGEPSTHLCGNDTFVPLF